MDSPSAPNGADFDGCLGVPEPAVFRASLTGRGAPLKRVGSSRVGNMDGEQKRGGRCRRWGGALVERADKAARERGLTEETCKSCRGARVL